MSIPAPGTRRAYLIAFLASIDRFYCHKCFQPCDMHLGSPIKYYALYHNIQRGFVQQENPSFDAPKF